jgi:hypothetical protein
MFQRTTPDNPALDALLDERETLRIQLRIALDSAAPDEERIAKLLDAIAEADEIIREHYPRP